MNEDLIELHSSDDDLSNCERGDGYSVETASLTKEPSLVSSFSNDTLEDCVVHSPAKIRRLRLRRGGVNNNKFVAPFEINFTEEELSYEHDDDKRYSLPRNGKSSVKSPHRIFLGLLLLPGLWFITSTAFGGSAKWRMPSRRSTARLARKIEQRAMTAKAKEAGMTLRLSGSRIDLLHQSLETHAYCDSISQVQIDWKVKDESFPAPLLAHGSQKVVAAGSSTKLETDAVLLLEERIRLTCSDLDRAFQQWRVDPSRIVGFLPDSHNTPFSQLSDHAAIVHRYYLSNRPRQIGDRNPCQHFSLSVFITAVSEKGPVLITSDLFRKGHYTAENNCLDALSLASGKEPMPAVATRYVGLLS